MKTFVFRGSEIPAKASSREINQLIKFLRRDGELKVEFTFKADTAHAERLSTEHVASLVLLLASVNIAVNHDRPTFEEYYDHDRQINYVNVSVMMRLAGDKGLAANPNVYIIKTEPKLATVLDFGLLIAAVKHHWANYVVMFEYDLPAQPERYETAGLIEQSALELMLEHVFRLSGLQLRNEYEMETAERSVSSDGSTARTILQLDPGGIDIDDERGDVLMYGGDEVVAKGDLDQRIVQTLASFIESKGSATLRLSMFECRLSEVRIRPVLELVRISFLTAGYSAFEIKKESLTTDGSDGGPVLTISITRKK